MHLPPCSLSFSLISLQPTRPEIRPFRLSAGYGVLGKNPVGWPTGARPLVNTSSRRRKEQTLVSSQSNGTSDCGNVSYAIIFSLPELFPPHTHLLLNVSTSTAILLRFEGTDLASCHRAFQLTPSATRVLWSLLRTYPAPCTYRLLFRALFPQAGEEKRFWETEGGRRPVRRALVTLLPFLRGCGLRAVSLRGQGYILAPMAWPPHWIRASLRSEQASEGGITPIGIPRRSSALLVTKETHASPKM